MSDAEKLADLRHHWGTAYIIWKSDRWHAADPKADVSLSASTAARLRLLIRADYDKRTVKR